RSGLCEHRRVARQESGARREREAAGAARGIQCAQPRELRGADAARVRRRDAERDAADDRRTDLANGELVAAGSTWGHADVLRSTRWTAGHSASGNGRLAVWGA